jgi:hypothetical protein
LNKANEELTQKVKEYEEFEKVHLLECSEYKKKLKETDKQTKEVIR